MSHVLRTGATRSGKTVRAVRSICEATDGAELILDPHKESLAWSAVEHLEGNVLFCRLSALKHSIGFDLITPSTDPDPDIRALENQLQAENFMQMMMISRESAIGPLMEEWAFSVLMLYLNNKNRFPPSIIPFALMPGTEEFEALMSGARRQERAKFETLRELKPKALRSEVGSTYRFLNSTLGSPTFSAWSRGGFDLGAFYQNKGKLIVERGDECGDASMRIIMGALSLQTIKLGVRRPKPYPHIRIRVDEAVNAGLAFHHLIKATAETAKNGVFVEFLVQNLNFPGGKEDEVIQNCLRKEWYRCPLYELARKAAVDILSGLGGSDETRTQRLEWLTTDIQNVKPGEYWVRDVNGSRKEYQPMLESPWPDWPDLRKAKLEEKLCRIYQRPEYNRTPPSGERDTPPSTTSGNDTLSLPPKSPTSSAAQRWKGTRKPAGGSSSTGSGNETA